MLKRLQKLQIYVATVLLEWYNVIYLITKVLQYKPDQYFDTLCKLIICLRRILISGLFALLHSLTGIAGSKIFVNVLRVEINFLQI